MRTQEVILSEGLRYPQAANSLTLRSQWPVGRSLERQRCQARIDALKKRPLCCAYGASAWAAHCIRSVHDADETWMGHPSQSKKMSKARAAMFVRKFFKIWL